MVGGEEHVCGEHDAASAIWNLSPIVTAAVADASAASNSPFSRNHVARVMAMRHCAGGVPARAAATSNAASSPSASTGSPAAVASMSSAR